MSWAIIAGLAGSVIGGAGSYFGGQEASGEVPKLGDLAYSGYDPRADPILALLQAGGSAGLGFAPDQNIMQAASPLNRLENSLQQSLGQGYIKSKNMKALNAAIQNAQGEFAAAQASGRPPDLTALEDAIENSFIEFRGHQARDIFAAAQGSIGGGATDPAAIARDLAIAKVGPYEPKSDDPEKEAKNLANYEEKIAKNVEVYLPSIQEGIDQGLTGSDLARHITGAFSEEKVNKAAGLFRTALSSAGFDNIGDLLAQETSYRERAGVQQASLTRQADSRLGARESASLTIDRLLRDYPAYGASDIERESQLALQPYQAQELEQANALGYNPATNLALTRTNGIRDALAILGGRQALANTALGSLGTVLGSQTGEALATAGQSQASIANAANIASQQALALQSLGMQGGMYQGSAQGGGLAGAGAALGGGIAQAGADYSSQQQFQQLIDALGSQPNV